MQARTFQVRCPSLTRCLYCGLFIIFALCVALICLLLVDDFFTSLIPNQSSNISILHHIHSDIPHDWISSHLYPSTDRKIVQKNKKIKSKTKKKSKKRNEKRRKSKKDFSLSSTLKYILYHMLFNDESHGQIFTDDLSFTKILHNYYQPQNMNDLLSEMMMDENISSSAIHPSSNISQWKHSYNKPQPIPHILKEKLQIKRNDSKTIQLSTNMIYHPSLKQFILTTISVNNVSHDSNEWCIEMYARNANPFFWNFTSISNSEQIPTNNESLINKLMNIPQLMIEKIGFSLDDKYETIHDLKKILEDEIIDDDDEYLMNHRSSENTVYHRIEKYLQMKHTFYESIYGRNTMNNKIQIVFEDWYPTNSQCFSSSNNPIFNDLQIQWSDDYQYLFVIIETNKESQLNIFQLGVENNTNDTYDNTINASENKTLVNELMDVLTNDYSYYSSSYLSLIFNIQAHEQLVLPSISGYSPVISFTVNKCRVYYAREYDQLLWHSVAFQELFKDKNTSHFSFVDEYQSHVDVNDDVLNKRWMDRRHIIHEMSVIDDVLLVGEEIIHNTHEFTFQSSLFNIPMNYRCLIVNETIDDVFISVEMDVQSNIVNTSVIIDNKEEKWFKIESKLLYKKAIAPTDYYYLHSGNTRNALNIEYENEKKIKKKKRKRNRKSDNLESFLLFGNLDEMKDKMNDKKIQFKSGLHSKPHIFFSNIQQSSKINKHLLYGRGAVISSTPYFTSLTVDKEFDETVEIVNIKPWTMFTKSALNMYGDVLAVMDNTDSILVLQKKYHLPIDVIFDDHIDEQLNDIIFHTLDVFPIGIQQKFNSIFMKKRQITHHFTVHHLIEIMDDNKHSSLNPFFTLLRERIPEYMQNDKKKSKKEIAWKVLAEFTPTPAMNHVRPLNILCITPDINDNDDDDVLAYIIVLFEQGIISSYVIHDHLYDDDDHSWLNSMLSDHHSSYSDYLISYSIDIFDWLEFFVMMVFFSITLCRCCSRGRLQINVNRLRRILPQPMVVQAQLPIVVPAPVVVLPVVEPPVNMNSQQLDARARELANGIREQLLQLFPDRRERQMRSAADGGNDDGQQRRTFVDNVNIRDGDGNVRNVKLQDVLSTLQTQLIDFQERVDTRIANESKNEEKEEKEHKNDDNDDNDDEVVDNMNEDNEVQDEIVGNNAEVIEEDENGNEEVSQNPVSSVS